MGKIELFHAFAHYMSLTSWGLINIALTISWIELTGGGGELSLPSIKNHLVLGDSSDDIDNIKQNANAAHVLVWFGFSSITLVHAFIFVSALGDRYESLFFFAMFLTLCVSCIFPISAGLIYTTSSLYDNNPTIGNIGHGPLVSIAAGSFSGITFLSLMGHYKFKIYAKVANDDDVEENVETKNPFDLRSSRR